MFGGLSIFRLRDACPYIVSKNDSIGNFCDTVSRKLHQMPQLNVLVSDRLNFLFVITCIKYRAASQHWMRISLFFNLKIDKLREGTMKRYSVSLPIGSWPLQGLALPLPPPPSFFLVALQPPRYNRTKSQLQLLYHTTWDPWDTSQYLYSKSRLWTLFGWLRCQSRSPELVPCSSDLYGKFDGSCTRLEMILVCHRCVPIWRQSWVLLRSCSQSSRQLCAYVQWFTDDLAPSHSLYLYEVS